MKHIKILFATATVIIAASLLLAGCALPFGIAQDTSVVTIQTGLMPSGARGSMPVDIESLRLVITAPDMQPIVQEFSGGDIQLEVPAGEMRLFSLQAFSAGGPAASVFTHYGAANVNLAGGQSTAVSIEMKSLESGMYSPLGTYYTAIYSPQALSFPHAVAAAALAAPPGWSSHLAVIRTADELMAFESEIPLAPDSRNWIGFTLFAFGGEVPVLAPVNGETWSLYQNFDDVPRDVSAGHLGVSMRGDFSDPVNEPAYTWQTQAADTKLHYYIIEFYNPDAGV